MNRLLSVLLVLLFSLTSCGSNKGVAMSNVVENYGGPGQLSQAEKECLKRHPQFESAIEETEKVAFVDRIANEPEAALACFGSRVVWALFPEKSVIGECWRAAFLEEWAGSIDQGERGYSDLVPKVMPTIQKDCGDLGR